MYVVMYLCMHGSFSIATAFVSYRVHTDLGSQGELQYNKKGTGKHGNVNCGCS